MSTPNALSFIELDPFWQWKLEENNDVLDLHLPEFKKEQLRVTVNDRGIVKISGECSNDSSQKSKFYKEVEVPKYCDPKGIRAKFTDDHLYVIMPKFCLRPPSDVKKQPKEDVAKPKVLFSTMKSCGNTSLKVAVAVAVLAALSSYVFYMYRSTTILED